MIVISFALIKFVLPAMVFAFSIPALIISRSRPSSKPTAVAQRALYTLCWPGMWICTSKTPFSVWTLAVMPSKPKFSTSVAYICFVIPYSLDSPSP